MANVEFINQVGPIAQKAYAELGKVRPSVCIAMAIVESAWGTAGSVKYNSYLGQKRGTGKTATKYWSGKSFSARTQECYDQASGQLTTIKDSFRCYDSMEQCVYNYYELLNTKLYKGVTDCDPWQQIRQIKDAGYFTSTTEVGTVRKLIEKYDLERFDGLSYDPEIVPPSNVDHKTPGAIPVFTGVASAMAWLDMDPSFEHRAKLAAQYGIDDYRGTAEQNRKLAHCIAIRSLTAALSILKED